jgi:hypothetical protein
VDMDIFARYFEKILINIPHSPKVAELEKWFSRELAKNPGIDVNKFKKIFCDRLISTFTTQAKASRNTRKLYKNFIESFQAYAGFRKERIEFIVAQSKNVKEFKQNYEILENQMRPLIGGALINKDPFRGTITKLIKQGGK